MSSARAVLVVPCFNEADRLDLDAFAAAMAADATVRYLFVDDGSTDDTRSMLAAFVAEHADQAELLGLDVNQGKAEAVRRGVLLAARSEPDYLGYWDADLATPLDQVARFISVLDARPHVEIVLGSRVNLLGHNVRRRLPRHYVGRVFATMVATGLSLPVYDTQCGAKMLRRSPHIVALFEEPFFSRWIFDAELLARAIDWSAHEGGPKDVRATMYELPLDTWHDVEGSRIRPQHLIGATRDLARIFARHTVASRFRRGRGGLTIRVASRVRRILGSLRVDGPRVSLPGRAARVVATIPTFGVFVLWTRLRNWISGPVSYEVTGTDGTRYVCRLPDLVQSYLFMFGVWEPDLTDFIRRRMAHGGHFVDVGANVGYHSLVASGSNPDAVQVVAIEASPRITDHLEMHIALNQRDNITVVNKAVADHHGKMRIFAGPKHNTGLTTSLQDRGFVEDAIVECDTLDAMLDDETMADVRLVKIDVEGAEREVLAGMAAFLDRCPESVELLVELSPRWWADSKVTPAAVLQPLFDRGFVAYEIDNNLWPWRYLWPDAVRPPRRSSRNFSRKPRRIDLVLSRVDAPSL